MSILQKPVANPEAPVGTREWAAALVEHFGEKLGGEYFARGLTFEEAAADFQTRRPRQRQGFAARLGRSSVLQRLAEPAAPVVPPPRGFARKIRFPGAERPASPAGEQAAAPRRELSPAQLPARREATLSNASAAGELEYLGFQAKLIFPHERRG